MSAHLTETLETEVDFAREYDESADVGSDELQYSADESADVGSNQPQYSAEDLSEFYYKLDCLLVQVDMAETHYAVLGVDYLSTTTEITNAYLRAMILLDPGTFGLEPLLTEALGPRTVIATERVAEAFRTLMDFDKRLEYDGRLFGWKNEGSKDNKLSLQKEKSNSKALPSKQDNDSRRARERFALSMPVAVTGYDENAIDWHEVVESVDLSRSGACVLLRRRVFIGNVLYLRMPMPTVLRAHEYLEQTYGTYAIVRWRRPPREGFGLVGLEFIGELPPPGFLQRPWATFNVAKPEGADRRAEPRESVSEAIEIEYFDESEQLIKKDSGFIEDISGSGARVCSQQPPLEADLIRIIRPKVSMSLFAVVRNRYKGRDGYERLCAQFINGSPPHDAR
jgi:hypothetical protein